MVEISRKSAPVDDQYLSFPDFISLKGSSATYEALNQDTGLLTKILYKRKRFTSL